ncbi:uncharacterized protein LOC34622142, partial [Cyclospora cayetanensis]|uniref:Uncharacterized protein LOC34622142 n=1 Tax=Cyclospora cayetanensis TaxID=88456 RepID=A0A6P6RQP7_9EIME
MTQAPVDGIDWPGLYRWSIKYSDGTSPNCRLSDEDVAFLRGAIQEAFAQEEKPNEVTKEQIAVIEKFLSGEAPARDCIAALSVLQRLTDDYPELSRDLSKLHALEPLLHLLSVPEDTAASGASLAASEQQQQQQYSQGRQQLPQEVPQESEAAKAFIILEKALEILAAVVQNNPQIQQAVADLGGLKVLFNLVRESPRSKALRVRSLQTLSCLLRNHRPSEELFLRSRGLNLLVYAIRSDDPKYQEKACSLCRHLVAEGLVSLESARETGLFTALEMLLPSLQDLLNVQFAETAMQLVIKLLQQHRMALCRSKELPALTASLNNRREWLESARSRLNSELEFLNARAAMKLLTAQESVKLEGLPYDLEAVNSQLVLVDEAVALTNVQHLIPTQQSQPRHKQVQHPSRAQQPPALPSGPAEA